MIRRLVSAARRLVTDDDVQLGTVEVRIALSQAAFIAIPVLLAFLGLMAALP
jgi:hypothetical protein